MKTNYDRRASKDRMTNTITKHRYVCIDHKQLVDFFQILEPFEHIFGFNNLNCTAVLLTLFKGKFFAVWKVREG